MLAAVAWLLATAVSVPGEARAMPRRIDVDCGSPHALDRALAGARKVPRVDIFLHGVCEGHFVIATEGVALYAASAGSGLAAPAGAAGPLAVLEIVNVPVNVHRLTVAGGALGVYAHGWDADVLLESVDVVGQSDAAVVASRGARIVLLDATVHDGATGIVADSSATLNLQRVVVKNLGVGVVVFEKSDAALNDSTIENCREAGLNASLYSNVNVLGGTFRENGQGHIAASDWSSITFVTDVTIGSETDATPFSLGVTRHATIASYNVQNVYGDVSAIDGGSIRLGNTTLHGDLFVWQFADVLVRDSRVLGIVACMDGAQAICNQTTTKGVFDCPSATCGSPAARAGERASSARAFPRTPSLEWLQRLRSGR